MSNNALIKYINNKNIGCEIDTSANVDTVGIPDPTSVPAGFSIEIGGVFKISDGVQWCAPQTEQGTNQVTRPGIQKYAVQPDCKLHVVGGSALDMSSTISTSVPAGIRGPIVISSTYSDRLVEANNPSTKVKFSIATLVPDPTFVPLPTNKAKITAGVEHLRKCGYNAVRIHGIENWLMAGQYGECTFNTDRLDLYDFFLAECKRVGIYWVFNPQSYILYSDGNGTNNRFNYTADTNCKPRIYVEQTIRDLWKKGFEKLYNRVNIYTGTNIITDPALMQIELYNESSVSFVAGKEFPKQWKTRTAGTTPAAKTWVEWLSDPAQQHGYATLAALNTAWGTSYASYVDAAAATVGYLNVGMANNMVQLDALLYGLFLEDDLAAYYQSCLTQWGYTGLSCMHNLFPANVVSRNVSRMDINKVANSHGYAMLASGLTAGEALTSDNVPIWNFGSWLFGCSMMGGTKPKWFGEHGWPAWGKYRNQYPIVYALAGMQGVSGVSYFSQGDFFNPVYRNDTTTHGNRTRRVEPYHNPSDPTADFIRVLQAVLFGRGDVSESSYTQSYLMSDRYYGVNPKNTGRLYRAMAYSFQPLYFTAGIAKTQLTYTPDTTDDTLAANWNTKAWSTLLQDLRTANAITADNMSLVSALANNGNITGVATTGVINGVTATETAPIITVASHTLVDGDHIYVTSLTGSVGTWPGTNGRNTYCVVKVVDSTHLQLTSGLTLTGLSGANFTSGTWTEGANVIQASTKEWGMSRRLRYCWVDTDKTKYIGNDTATLPVQLNNLTVSVLSPGAAVFVTSLDNLPITSSKRLLVGLVGDAKNAGMTFTDATEKTLQTTGDYPIVVSDMSCQMRINAVPTALPKVYPLNRDGTRATSIGMAAPVDPTGIYLDLRNGMSSTIFWEIDMRN